MEPSLLENKCLYNSDMNLWKQCDVVNLTTNFRVGDSGWNQTLQRIRFGEQTEDDLKLLRTRYTTNFNRTDWDNALHAFYTRAEVHKHNSQMLENLKTDLQTIKAELPKGKHQIPTKQGTIDDTGFAFKLDIKKGANVMCIHNVNVNDGIVNGGNLTLYLTFYCCLGDISSCVH